MEIVKDRVVNSMDGSKHTYLPSASPDHLVGAFRPRDTLWAHATIDTIDPQNQSIEPE